jgi:hypothetical protein
MMKINSLLAIICFSLATPAFAANGPARGYLSDAEIVVKIGHDLYATLDPACKKVLSPTAVALQPSSVPFIAPIPASDYGARGQVAVSTGFITLLNQIAHAKAIDRLQPGYFSQYIADLAQENGSKKLPAPRHLDNPRFWKDDILVEQASLFNQMIGLTLALNLSHHYLAHCGKYAAQMPEGNNAPINNFITPDEWAASLQCAALNSLDCALATAGGKVLFDCIDHMPQRAAWTVSVVPLNVDLKLMNQQLSQYERQYFHGGLKARARSIVLSTAAANNAHY